MQPLTLFLELVFFALCDIATLVVSADSFFLRFTADFSKFTWSSTEHPLSSSLDLSPSSRPSQHRIADQISAIHVAGSVGPSTQATAFAIARLF